MHPLIHLCDISFAAVAGEGLKVLVAGAGALTGATQKEGAGVKGESPGTGRGRRKGLWPCICLALWLQGGRLHPCGLRRGQGAQDRSPQRSQPPRAHPVLPSLAQVWGFCAQHRKGLWGRR